VFGRDPFLVGLALDWESVDDKDAYPFSIPAIRALTTQKLHPQVTFFVGENGSGKSTLLEAIAVAAGFNAEGGSKNFRFATRQSHSPLHQHLKLDRGRNIRKPKDGFFFRAESFFNVATEIENLEKGLAGPITGYGDVRLHDQSHGESFLALVENRFWGNGLYLLDEPEAALSPARQLRFLAHLHRLVSEKRSQFVIATHSPIILGYPRASILQFSDEGLREVAYEDTEHFRITRDFVTQRDAVLATMFDYEPGDF
jgi:predicted ATPase